MSDALMHFVVNGNKVLELKLVRSPDDIEDEASSFAPDMCHQVFGQNENIFGYTDLRIRLYYTAGCLQPYLNIDYSEKFKPSNSEEMKADDIEGAMKKILAPGYTRNLDQFVSLLEKDKTFRPMGKMLHSFTSTSRNSGDEYTFEVYFCDTTTPGFLLFHKRLQTFLLWYVDAASFIDVDDEQWTFFIVFEKYPIMKKNKKGGWAYAVAGYATVYNDHEAHEQPAPAHAQPAPVHARPRISQVLTLPPFRELGVCANLLQAIYSHFISLPSVIDMTVEEPSKKFQRIRDYVDCKNCETLPAFNRAKLHQGFSPQMESQACAKFKINKEQVRRVYEILRLRATNTSNKTQYLQYRLDVEKRLHVPLHKRRSEMMKLKKELKPEEYVARRRTSLDVMLLSRQYLALVYDYRRVLDRLEYD